VTIESAANTIVNNPITLGGVLVILKPPISLLIPTQLESGAGLEKILPRLPQIGFPVAEALVDSALSSP
jgi:hypothetical protein